MTTPTRRRKHDPAVSRREILRSAADLLQERPLREISVDAVMSGTGLKRPAFYAHFRDRNDVVLHLVQDLGEDLLAALGPWLADDDQPQVDVRTALDHLAAVYAEHGRLLRALADAASADAQVDEAYRQTVQQFVAATARHIRREQAAGRIGDLPDVDEVARALVCMEERYLIETLGRTPTTDPKLVVDVLHHIWTSTLHTTTPPNA